MARIALTVSELVPNGKLADPAGTVGNADGHFVAGVQPEELVLRVVVATAEIDVTIGAGANPPALESKAQVHTCAVGTHWIGPFTSGQVGQADGSIHVDYETAANATVTAFHLPRTA